MFPKFVSGTCHASKSRALPSRMPLGLLGEQTRTMLPAIKPAAPLLACVIRRVFFVRMPQGTSLPRSGVPSNPARQWVPTQTGIFVASRNWSPLARTVSGGSRISCLRVSFVVFCKKWGYSPLTRGYFLTKIKAVNPPCSLLRRVFFLVVLNREAFSHEIRKACHDL